MPKINKKVAEIEKNLRYLNPKEAELLGFDKEGNNVSAFVYMKYYDHTHQCFSEWQPDELRLFSAFIDKLRKITWTDIYKSGGKSGKKVGLGYTIHKDTDILPNQNIVKLLSEDTLFFELRVGGKIRVHGFRLRSAFCLIWLDRNHEIYKS